MALADNLVAYWELDDVTDSAGTNDLTNSNATFTTGKVGNAADFQSSSNSTLVINDNTDISTGDIDFTIQCWANLDGTGTTNALVGKWETADREWLLYYDASATRFKFIVDDGASGTSTATADNFGAPSSATWYLIHAWHDAANNLIGISVNAGTADTTSHTTGVNDGTDRLEFGRNTASLNYLDGLLDEVAMWKRVLSSAERTELYNSGSGRDYAYVSGGGGGPAAIGALSNFNVLIQ